MTKEELILENTELRARLFLAEKWMRREVASAIRHVGEDAQKKSGRKKLYNILEQERLDIITRQIIENFGNSLDSAPKYTLERLIDAEIYWSTLQQYPTMDGLPIILAYQKILDAWIEEKLIADFRRYFMGKIEKGSESLGLDRDIENIVFRQYAFSLGRLYQLLKMLREYAPLSPLTQDLVMFWKQRTPDIFTNLVSDEFFLPFAELMDREIFSKKRHEKKVTFGDVKNLKERILIVLKLIF